MISILSYNVRGVSSIKKQLLLRKWIETNPHDVLLLQELHMTTQAQLESFKQSFPDYIITCSLGTWSAGGVIVMNKHKLGIIDHGIDQCGRVAYIKVIVNNCPIAIASVYAPTQPNDRCELFENLHLHIPSSHYMLVGGDFNCYPDPTKDRSHQGDRVDRRSYSFLNSHFLQSRSLLELYRSKHPKSITYSFHSDSKNMHSRIDFFFGTRMVYKSINYISYIPIGLSDHDGITITLSFPSTSPAEYRRWICNVEVIKRSSFLPRFKRIWEIIEQTSNFNNLSWWSDLKTSLTLLLQDEQKQMIKEKRKKMKDLQDHYRVLSTNPDAANLIEMAKVRVAIRELLIEKSMANNHGYRERSTQVLGEIAQSRLSSARSNQSTIQSLIDPSKGRVSDTDGMLKIATNFYQDLYSVKTIDSSLWTTLFNGLPKLSNVDKDVLEREISVEECYKALLSMPDRKSPGDDGIPTEV